MSAVEAAPSPEPAKLEVEPKRVRKTVRQPLSVHLNGEILDVTLRPNTQVDWFEQPGRRDQHNYQVMSGDYAGFYFSLDTRASQNFNIG